MVEAEIDVSKHRAIEFSKECINSWKKHGLDPSLAAIGNSFASWIRMMRVVTCDKVS